eukprot:2903940-Prymnesium_polylepis.1
MRSTINHGIPSIVLCLQAPPWFSTRSTSLRNSRKLTKLMMYMSQPVVNRRTFIVLTPEAMAPMGIESAEVRPRLAASNGSLSPNVRRRK